MRRFIVIFFCLVSFSLYAQEIDASRIKSPAVPADGHSYVDLGLSVKWATSNVGAMSPVGAGNHYAWGEIEAKDYYSNETSVTFHYNYADISGNPDFDVAAAEWGGLWRMPTKKELEELAACKWEISEVNGVRVNVVTGPNGNMIIIPIPGWKDKGNLNDIGVYGCYWSSTPHEQYPHDPIHENAYFMPVRNSWYYPQIGEDNRGVGYAVRPVYGERKIDKQPKHEKLKEWVSKPSGTKDGYEYVDLGLSVKWASCNVGAIDPYSFGDYYAWGEVKTKSSYDQDNYSIDFDLKDFAGDPKYDTAAANMGGDWRMPTKAEAEELIKKCKYSQVPIKGRYYGKFTAPNGNSIIFPIAGSINDTTKGGGPLSWVAEPKYGGFRPNATGLEGTSTNSTPRYWGANVRAVIK